MFPIQICRVTSQVPEQGGLIVQLRSGQQPGLPVKVLYQGPADALRLYQRPLPPPGTWGLVIFANGDIRNGIWIGSYYTSLQDAITASAANPTSANIDYEAHWSGFWRLVDDQGQEAVSWPDGSFMTVAASGVAPPLPTMYRHIVDDQNAQQRIPYPTSDRIASVPSPFWFHYRHASGTDISIAPIGDTEITGAPGAFLTASFGGTMVSIDGFGNVQFTGAAGASISALFGETTVKLDSSGNFAIKPPGVGWKFLKAIGIATADADYYQVYIRGDGKWGVTGTAGTTGIMAIP